MHGLDTGMLTQQGTVFHMGGCADAGNKAAVVYWMLSLQFWDFEQRQ
jgi:hypothetical protein